MKKLLLGAVMVGSVGMAQTPPPPTPAPTPAPAAAAAAAPKLRSPGDALAESAPTDWAEIAPEDLMVMELDGGRRVVIQLAPQFAPAHVDNIKLMARSGYWAKATIYRVVDNWVTQWGMGEDDAEPPLPKGAAAQPPQEYERSAEGLTLLPQGSPDPYSSMAAYALNWPVAMAATGRVNLAYCYGTVGVARGAAPDTGSGSELFAIIGTPSRRLDRNYAAVGRVIEGIENLSALPRGKDAQGVYAKDQPTHPIRAVKIVSDMPAADRPRFEVLRQNSRGFADYLHLASHRYDYGVGSPGAALCATLVPVRAIKATPAQK